MRHRILMTMLGCALLAGLSIPGFQPGSASAAPTPRAPAAIAAHRERAPECVTVKVLNPSTGTSFFLQGCGSGPGRESWIQDFMTGHTVTVDGAAVNPVGCGSQASPCVTFASLSPPS